MYPTPPNVRERDPFVGTPHHETDTTVTPEDMEAMNSDLYGDSVTAVEDIPEIDEAQVNRASGNKLTPDAIGDTVVPETGFETDATEVRYGAEAVLGRFGAADEIADYNAVRGRVLAEGFTDGTDSNSGELDNLSQRDVENAVIADGLYRQMDNPDRKKEIYEQLPPYAAQKMAAAYAAMENNPGNSERATNDQLAYIGQIIVNAEIVHDSTQEVVTVDEASGEVTVERTEDIAVRVMDGDNDALEQLPPEHQENLQTLMAGYGDIKQAKPEQQKEVARYIIEGIQQAK